MGIIYLSDLFLTLQGSGYTYYKDLLIFCIIRNLMCEGCNSIQSLIVEYCHLLFKIEINNFRIILRNTDIPMS